MKENDFFFRENFFFVLLREPKASFRKRNSHVFHYIMLCYAMLCFIKNPNDSEFRYIFRLKI